MNRALKIAIQGGPASFHETAAKQLFPASSISTLSCASFPELCEALESGLVDFAVMAVQNSLAGPLLPNYGLMNQHGLSITAERWLLLDQTLMALPGQKLEDIQEIWSHPIALLQCCDYIESHPGVKTRETADTADTARLLKEGQIKGVAAIASRKAAELYGLEVLHDNVANAEENYTRFVVLSREKTTKAANKATLLLPYPVVRFSLENVLEKLDQELLELTMLQPLPSSNPGQPAQWVLELEGEQAACITQALAALRTVAPKHTVLGLYPKAEAPLPQDRLAGCLSSILTAKSELV
ncbi:prephenate dehydratase domain-containing protein [Rufibacter sp. XAAS-G3-1]|uniref:prephenate dehydratase n=1 Tax=Rufibacter sp. XAAS-G3-1 TaxID=2729134 RepID=UPI0015E656D5|nr:prephenate dehydratase domain-containing protein [Rufibacter sp. XAAS-G3-1]